jgi:protein-disulfide isomerase
LREQIFRRIVVALAVLGLTTSGLLFWLRAVGSIGFLGPLAHSASGDFFGLAVEPLAAGWFATVLLLLSPVVRSVRPRTWEDLFWLSVPAIAASFNLAMRTGQVVLSYPLVVVSLACVGTVGAIAFMRRDSDAPDHGPIEARRTRFAALVPLVSVLLVLAGTLFSSRTLWAKTSARGAVAPTQWTKAQTISWWEEQKRSTGSTKAHLGDGKVVSYSDYQCPACLHAFLQRSKLRAQLRAAGLQLDYTVKDYPLDASCNRYVGATLHPAACEAAIGVRSLTGDARNELEKWLYANQKELTSALVIDKVMGLGGITRGQYDADRPRLMAAVLADIEEAHRLGVLGTPAIFIDGVGLGGSMPAEVLAILIEHEKETVAR